MKSNPRRFAAIVGIGLALIMPINRAFAHSESLEQLSAEWWQWALSIPASVNPQLETDSKQADTCMIGQRGRVWFLAGVFSGGAAKRTCSVPESIALFFPVINSIGLNTPGVCGQPGSLTASELRTMAAESLAGATKLPVTLDGKAITYLRVRSTVFAVALPENNVFNLPCGGPGMVPAGIYSPAVGDGFYALLDPLSRGKHTLRFHAEIPNAADPSKSFVQDVTYKLTVVAVSLTE